MFSRILFIIALLPSLLGAQHSIKGDFTPAEEYEWAILYKVTPSLMYYTVDTRVASDGSFELKLDSTVTPGVYRIVYDVPQETFNFDIVYNGKEDVELTFNLEKGVSFISSEENKMLAQYRTESKEMDSKIGEYYQTSDAKALKLMFQQRQDLQDRFEKESANMYVSSFIKASKPYIPSSNESLESYTKNRMNTYFDAIHIGDSVLQNSSFLGQKCYEFLQSFEVESSEKNIDRVVSFLKGGDLKLQKGIQYGIWTNLVAAENFEAANYLASSSLIPLAKSLDDEIMAETLQVFKNTTFGTQPPNFSWEAEKDDKTIEQNLHDLDIADNYILVFWSSSCSHCLKEIPKLHEAVKNFDEGKYKVIAIGLEDTPEQWKSETYYYPEFIHVLGLGKWENRIGNDYGISATPSYFVLDKDKNITHKPEELKDLLEVIK